MSKQDVLEPRDKRQKNIQEIPPERFGIELKEFKPGPHDERLDKKKRRVEKFDKFFGKKLEGALKGVHGSGRRVLVSERERLLTALKYFTGEKADEHIEHAAELVGRKNLTGKEAKLARFYEGFVTHPVTSKRGYFTRLLYMMGENGIKPKIVDQFEEILKTTSEKTNQNIYPERKFGCDVHSALKFCDKGQAFTIKNLVVIDKHELTSMDMVREANSQLKKLERWAIEEDKIDEQYLEATLKNPESFAQAYGTITMIRVARNKLRLPILERAAKYIGREPNGRLRLGGRSPEYAIAAAARDLGEGLEDTSAKRNIGEYRAVANSLIKRLREQDPQAEMKKIGDIIKSLDSHRIIVTDDLSPELAQTIAENTNIDTVVFDRKETATSHSAILLQNKGMRLVSSRGCAKKIHTDEEVLVDCFSENPSITSCPSRKESVQFDERQREYRLFMKKFKTKAHQPVKTKDGKLLTIMGNVDSVETLKEAVDLGVHGIGLFRTEYGIIGRTDLTPENLEEKLTSQYADFIKKFHKRASRSGETVKVHFRLFDFGRGKYPPFSWINQRNVEEYQGVQFLISNPEILESQTKALMRANEGTKSTVNVEIPYWSKPEEVWDVVETIKRQKIQLKNEGKGHSPIRIGVMVETDQAVKNLAKVLESKDIDFVSIGANDLKTEDESNHALHPRVLKRIKKIIDTSKDAEKPVKLCGEVAANPIGAVLLAGMGLTDTTVSPQIRPFVTTILTSLKMTDMKKIADEALRMRGEGAEYRVKQLVHKRLTELGVNINKSHLSQPDEAKKGKSEKLITPQAEKLIEDLRDITSGHVDCRTGCARDNANKDSDVVRGEDGYFYYARHVSNVAGGGLHTRIAMALTRHLTQGGVEIFSPLKAKKGKMSNFESYDTSQAVGAADNGDTVYFRSQSRSAVNQVQSFFRTTRMTTEISRGD